MPKRKMKAYLFGFIEAIVSSEMYYPQNVIETFCYESGGFGIMLYVIFVLLILLSVYIASLGMAYRWMSKDNPTITNVLIGIKNFVISSALTIISYFVLMMPLFFYWYNSNYEYPQTSTIIIILIYVFLAIILYSIIFKYFQKEEVDRSELSERLIMNNERRSRFAEATELVKQVTAIIKNIKIEEEKTLDNLSEDLQKNEQSEDIRKYIDLLDEFQDDLEYWINEIREA